MSENKKQKLFCIVGETASGKDYIVSHLTNWFDAPHNLRNTVSYTTRPRRDNETDGLEHYFISDNEFNEIKNEKLIVAETQIGTYRYMCTYKEVQESDIYIIDPKGIKSLKNFILYFNPDFEFVTIYIYAPLEDRIKRASTRSDFNDAFKARVEAEEDQFKEFRENKEFDYIIFNVDGSADFSINTLENIMNYELNIKK